MRDPRMPLWIGGTFLVGVLTAIQARMNGGLGAEIGDAFVAAFISFGSGFVILLVLAAVLPAGRSGVGRLVGSLRARTLPLWMILAGAAGAFAVSVQSLSIATIGVALFTVGVVAGQTVCGILLDRAGIGPAGVVAVTVPRVAGGFIVLAAVAVSLVGGRLAEVPWWMLVLPFFAGAGIAWQQATNGRLRQRIDSALAATTVNFAGGTTVLGLVLLARSPWMGELTFPDSPVLYLGGAAGVVYIFLSASLVRRTGVLLLGLGSVCGLLSTSIVLDLVWPAAAGAPLGTAIVATAVAFIGILVVIIPRRRGH